MSQWDNTHKTGHETVDADGEANCGPVHNRYTQFDNFLAREIPLIEQSPAFGPNDVIIVTYDEDERAGGLAKKNGFGQGGHVVCAILSAMTAHAKFGNEPGIRMLAPT